MKKTFLSLFMLTLLCSTGLMAQNTDSLSKVIAQQDKTIERNFEVIDSQFQVMKDLNKKIKSEWSWKKSRHLVLIALMKQEGFTENEIDVAISSFPDTTESVGWSGSSPGNRHVFKESVIYNTDVNADLYRTDSFVVNGVSGTLFTFTNSRKVEVVVSHFSCSGEGSFTKVTLKPGQSLHYHATGGKSFSVFFTPN